MFATADDPAAEVAQAGDSTGARPRLNIPCRFEEGKDLRHQIEFADPQSEPVERPGDVDGAIREMISVNRPVIFDCVVDPNENCFPMIPSGRAHNEMLLGDATVSVEDAITEEGKVMV